MAPKRRRYPGKSKVSLCICTISDDLLTAANSLLNFFFVGGNTERVVRVAAMFRKMNKPNERVLSRGFYRGRKSQE